MEEAVWRNFPSELFVNVAASLPFLSLLRLRAVSKSWNSFPLDPRFKELRPSTCREFLEHIHQCQRFESWNSYEDSHCTEGFLLRELNGDTYVMRPSDVLLKQIEIPWNFRVVDEGEGHVSYVVNMVVDQKTKHYTIYWAKNECSQSPGQEMIDCMLFTYDSVTGIWSPCGTQIEPYEAILAGVVVHEGRHMLLVEYPTCEVQSLDADTQEWNTLRLPAEAEAWQINASRLFQHGGETLLILSSEQGCCLWQYQGDQLGWRLRDQIPIILRLNGTSQAHVDGVPESCIPPHVFGSFIFFECHKLKYNLDTKQMEAMSTGESEMMLRYFRPNYRTTLEQIQREVQTRSEALSAGEMDILLRRVFEPQR